MTFDVFISYPHADADAVRPVTTALRASGVSVWFDESAIADGQSITRAVIDGLNQSRLLVTWYSRHYALSRPCQWELTTAWLAAQREGGDVERRILVINPEPETGHIHPIDLADAKFLDAALGAERLAAKIVARLRDIASRFGDIPPAQPVRWHGTRRTGSNRFVGRVPEMWQVHSGLRRSSVAIISGAAPGTDLVQISGLGGIGKSLLAEEYALRFGQAYPGGIVWLTATRPEDAGRETDDQIRDRSFYELAVRLGLPVQGLAPGEVVAAVGHHMSHWPVYLWIVDDLPADAEAGLLNAWLAPTENGRTLVTTRSTRLDGSGFVLPLGILHPDEAFDLLTSRRPVRNETEKYAAVAICAELGCHALAVDIAGAAVRRMGYASFLEKLRRPDADALKLAEILAPELPNGHQPGIAATLLQSVRRLRAAGLLVLQLASILAASAVPTDLFAAVFERLDSGAGGGEMTAWSGIADAESEALAEVTGDAGVLVHVLVSRTLRLEAPASPDLRGHAVMALSQTLERTDDVRAHAAVIPFVDHARVLSSDIPDVPTADLLDRVAKFDHFRGDFRQAVEAFGTERDARARLQSDEHPDTLTAAANLVAALFGAGRFTEALTLGEEVVKCRRRVLGDADVDTLTAMNNVATILRAMGRYDDAGRLDETVLAARRNALGDDHVDTLGSLNNLAESLRIAGDLATAGNLHAEALARRRRVLGDDHPDTLQSMNNVAETMMVMGDFEQARALHADVLAARRRILGDEHPETLLSINNLAASCWHCGHDSEALDLQQELVATSARRLGKEHPDTLATYNNLAIMYWRYGDIEKAEGLLDEIVSIRTRLLGRDHPDTLNSLNSLAAVLFDQDKFEVAGELHALVFGARCGKLGGAHPDTLVSGANLCGALIGAGDLATASVLADGLYRIATETLGRAHPTTKVLAEYVAALYDHPNL